MGLHIGNSNCRRYGVNRGRGWAGVDSIFGTDVRVGVGVLYVHGHVFYFRPGFNARCLPRIETRVLRGTHKYSATGKLYFCNGFLGPKS